MPQTPGAQAFISRISALPKDTPVSLDEILEYSIVDETELRRQFATDPGNPRLKDLYVGLVDIFDAPQDIRTTRARVVRDEFDLNEKCIMPLSEARRRKEGTPAMVTDLDEFKRNWAIFTENSLSLLDWTNVVAAGGSVLACLAPVPDASKESKRSLRKYFHTNSFPTSDVDLFLYGMTPGQAEAKIISIYQAVRDAVPWDCTCIRTKHSISIHSQYPYRCVQIVLRLYSSPAEVLAGFDVDAPCCAYDGTRVWANPRAIVAMMRQCNTIDITRRSPSYEVRLSKYSYRDFEVYVPTLKREDVDPTIFERSIGRVAGLARLIVLERLYSPESRAEYLKSRRDLRGRPTHRDVRQRRRMHKGDLKANMPEESLAISSYDVVSLHIPYGPGWDARRINKLVYQTDLGMNSPFNPNNKGRRIHRHPAFFGNIEECLEDCCEFCPDPKNEEEKTIQEEEDKVFIRGRIEFMQEDPGRQSISGSFNPIDDGEWAEQAYIGESEKLCKAILSIDRVSVLRMIRTDDQDVNRRDHVGRTPLHIAIIARASDIACDLIDAGARMIARLADGRTALHLAAQLDLPEVARKLLQRSAVNKEKADEAEATKNAKEAQMVDEDDTMDGANDDEAESNLDEGNSSNDDWSSEDDKEKKADDDLGQKDEPKDGNIPEDEDDMPDVFDVNLPDWDFGLTPLEYAIIFGSLGIVDQLIVAGADPVRVNKSNSYGVEPSHPLTLTILTEDDERASRIVDRLLQAGAKSSTANASLLSIFHRFVCSQKPKLVSVLLRADPSAKGLVNFPSVDYNNAIFPSVSAVQSGDYATLALLLAHGAKVLFTADDVQIARDALENQDAIQQDNLKVIRSPVETAIARHDHIVHLLVALGAQVNLPVYRAYAFRWESNRLSLNDWVLAEIRRVDERLTKEHTTTKEEQPMDESSSVQSGWKAYYSDIVRKLRKSPELQVQIREMRERARKEKKALLALREYLQDVKTLFAEKKAKSWNELFPDNPVPTETLAQEYQTERWPGIEIPYKRLASYLEVPVAENQISLYDELYEACWNGNNQRIQELCLPKEGSKSSQPPLQIVVVTSKGKLSPFFVAIHRRHWTTARLVLAIASAQQIRPGEEDSAAKFSTVNIKLDDDDSDSENSEDDDEEDDDIDADENEEISFIDLAQRKTVARYPVAPEQLLQIQTDKQLGGMEGYNPMNRAIVQGDFEAFVQIADLCKALPKPIPLNQAMDENCLFLKDRVEILDEYIRRSGNGIHIPTKQETEKGDGTPDRPTGKEYWGLNVHGKKRRDLASRGDPNSPSPADDVGPTPLVWRASQFCALEVLKYLASDRPLAAYRYYTSTNTNDKRFRNVSDLAPILPAKLGWCSNFANETPLVAAVMQNRLDSVKVLFSLRPKMMREYLHYKTLFSGFNLMLRAVKANCSPEFIDYLLSNGVSATHFDLRGWNVIHVACADNRIRPLKCLLERLSKDLVDGLLVQQSKPFLNTPLHIAVRKRNIGIVKLLVSVKTPALLLRDINGFTPLHVAVKHGFGEITKILAQASPTEALYMENAVGEIPTETAIQQDLIERYRNDFRGKLVMPDTLSTSTTWVQTDPNPFDLSVMETRVPALKIMIDELLKDGRLTRGTRLFNALVEFADKMEAKMAQVRVEQVEPVAVGEGWNDSEKDEADVLNADQCHRAKTLCFIREAVKERPTMHRLLVHLADVQKSVLNHLPQRDDKKTTKDEDELDGEKVEVENIHPSTCWLGDYRIHGDLSA